LGEKKIQTGVWLGNSVKLLQNNIWINEILIPFIGIKDLCENK